MATTKQNALPPSTHKLELSRANTPCECTTQQLQWPITADACTYACYTSHMQAHQFMSWMSMHNRRSTWQVQVWAKALPTENTIHSHSTTIVSFWLPRRWLNHLENLKVIQCSHISTCKWVTCACKRAKCLGARSANFLTAMWLVHCCKKNHHFCAWIYHSSGWQKQRTFNCRSDSRSVAGRKQLQLSITIVVALLAAFNLVKGSYSTTVRFFYTSLKGESPPTPPPLQTLHMYVAYTQNMHGSSP